MLGQLSSSVSGMPIAGSNAQSREISLMGGMTGSTLSPASSSTSIDSIASNVFAAKMSLSGIEAGDLLQAAGYQEFQLDKRERGGFQEVVANDLVSNDTGLFVPESCEVYFGYTPRKAAT